ncbi:MAG: RIP metalloprotease RseP [Candidatus Omnitrophota bacterium]|jgi:regulator of sigma E protease|nr:MAG: RIP metalloprotease RseP [Candidatus Omnitrophota bacterium]
MNLDSIVSTFFSVFHFLVVLGLAVIFHEWGHFIVAKLSGAKVDRFAVGFGKVLFSRHWHDTEYALCALPLGGYVKIKGMDPDDETTGAEWEFLQLAAWKRILIVLAGPVMNFVLAFLLYVLVFMSFGEAYTATTTIGHVSPGSWGWEMGLRNGDKIVAINDKEITSWEDVLLTQSDFEKDQFRIIVDRDGSRLDKHYQIPKGYADDAEFVRPPDLFEGIFLTRILPGSAAEQAGLKAGTEILSANGTTFETREEWSKYFSAQYEQDAEGKYQPKEVRVVTRDTQGATTAILITPELVFPAEDAIPNQPVTRLGLLFHGEISVEENLLPTVNPIGITPKLNPVIGGVQEGSPAESAGITRGSRIVRLNDQEIDDFNDIRIIVQESLEEQEDGTVAARPLAVTWLTPQSEMKNGTVTPEIIKEPMLTRSSLKTGKLYYLARIGIDQQYDRKTMGVIGSIVAGWQKTIHICGFMIGFLYDLFTGGVSPKLVGGPIAIYQISAETGRWGLERFLSFIALLSANLGLINLFPLPPFDGGHILFYSYEIIRMKPVTMKQMENFGKIGFALIIPLILWIFINDLNRIEFFSWIGGLIQKAFGAS